MQLAFTVPPLMVSIALPAALATVIKLLVADVIEPPPATLSVPPLTVVGPVYVLDPLKVSVPAPNLVSDPLPLMAPE